MGTIVPRAEQDAADVIVAASVIVAQARPQSVVVADAPVPVQSGLCKLEAAALSI